MGSKFVTVKQAAKILDVSTRSIFRYAARGLFEAKTEGRRVLISEDDIVKLKKGRRDVLSSPLQRDILTKLQVEVQTLKSHMATVLRILNVRYEPLNMTVPEFDLLYRSAEQLSMEGWSPHVEEMWADYLVRMRIEDLNKLEIATNDPHPWRPFMRLSATMHLSPWKKELTEVLGAGRNNIQQLAGMWCVLKEVSPRTLDTIIERDASPLKKLLRRMQKDQV